MKQQSRCDLPLGSKRVSFISRTRTHQPVKKQKILTFQNILNENQFIVPPTYLLNNHTQVAQTKPVKTDTMTPCHSTPDPPLAQSSAPPSSKKPPNTPVPNLEMVAYQLTQDLTNIFMQRQEWSMYHKEVVLQDNIRGAKVVGLDKYMLLVNVLRLLAHIRFVYVRMSLLSLTKEEEEGIIKVRWSVVGLGMGRLVLRYFPDRLWEKGNMERLSPSYIDGHSTFYVDSDSKIYQHTVDRVMEDKDKVVMKTVVQKLMELKQRAATQPAL